MEVRQSWVYGDSPGEHFSRELRGVGIFFNCQNSSGAGSQLLDNEHCRFAVQNGTHISFTCSYLISIPITDSMHRQALLVDRKSVV